MAQPIVTQSIEGVNLGAIYPAAFSNASAISATNDPNIPGLPFVIGTRVIATDGSEWIFATASAGINQYDTVMINPAFSAAQILGGAAAEVPSKIIGFYQNSTALTATDSAWFMVSGKPVINVLGAAVKNVQLYTTNTSGKLDDAVVTGSQFPIRGVYIVSTNPSATATAIQAQAMYPTVGVIGAV